MVQRVLVPLDGSHLAECAIPHALAVATTFEAQVILLRVTEIPRAGIVDPTEWRLSRAEANAYLQALIPRLDGVRVRSLLAEGDPAPQIIETARREHVDLVVLSSHGIGGRSPLCLGGTFQKVVHGIGISVLAVPPDQPDPGLAPSRYTRIVTPLDFSRRSDWALQVAAALARRHQAELCLAHIVVEPDLARHAGATETERSVGRKLAEADRVRSRTRLDAEAARLATPHLTVSTQLVSSVNAAEGIHDLIETEPTDLVVMSARGMTHSTRRPYGGVPSAMLSALACPTLVLQDAARRLRALDARRDQVRAARRFVSRPER